MKKFVSIIFLLTIILSFNVFAAGSLTATILSVTPDPVTHAGILNINLNLTNAAATAIDPLVISTSNATGPNNALLIIARQLTTETVNPSTSKTLTVQITIPQGTAPGRYTATINAEETDNTVNRETISYSFNVAASPNINVQLNNVIINELNIPLEISKDDNEVTIKLQNTGNLNLTNVRVTGVFSSLQDPEGDLIAISNPTLISTLNMNQLVNATFNFNVDSGFDMIEVGGTLKIEATEISTPIQIPFKLNPKPLACSANARAHNLEVDVLNPDSGDDFETGDGVNVDVEVKNNGNEDLHFRVETLLYNKVKDKRVDSKSASKTVDSDDTQNFRLNLTLGNKEEDRHTIFVKVFDDDDTKELNCRIQEIGIDVKKPRNGIKINNPTLSPLIASCGERVTGSAVLTNVGKNDEDVVFDVYNNQIIVNQVSRSVSIKEGKSDNERTINFDFGMPDVLKAGSYMIFLRAKYSGLETLKPVMLTVSQDCNRQTPQQPARVITPAQDTSSGNNFNLQPSAGQTVYPSTTSYEGKSIFDSFNTAKEIPTSVWVLIDVLLVILILGAIVWMFSRRR